MSNKIQAAQARIEDILARNKEYAKTAPKLPEIAQLRSTPSELRPPGVVIITCCDPRVIPEKFFNFGYGEFIVIRNAGGRAADALRSIAVPDQAQGIYAVLIVQHTDCGLTHVHNAGVRRGLKERVVDPARAAEIEEMDFGEIVGGDFDQSLRRDVKLVRDSKWFRGDVIVKGLLLDLRTGVVSERVG